MTSIQNEFGCAQRPKNLGSRVALLPGKFLRVQKVFARITEKNLVNWPNTFKTTQFFQMIANFPDDFKTVWIFPDDSQSSGLFQNCPDFSRWLPIFRMISKLSRFFQMTANFPDDFKTVRIFPDDYQFSGLFQNCPDFPGDCQFSRWFQNCTDFSRWLPIFQMISKLYGFF